ncbi:glycoside hydrolase family 1 protein [Clavibacter sepedonicus]|uniref:Glycoside hydrolase n=1 Tax=Clavibacter sepedonicus TaxID=31964 RepID=B0RH42_CLASE|nr:MULTISPECIES: family 1 glycosylhydrolase [Clavibacter]MBD5380288.1 family 1 glycosylhydrolase [Clavibacter sp.]OQJ48099.1 beta-glucosidase [Clavibacter sepedonicus]OQJ54656.1 beta-glucosidase [Clavibacter sepedonicus]UUK66236.1 family 1 glycosylhydrolase [Clavibacter sepedonicus]CAQ02518.1 putative glycoside hydrolase [Clavibacter sepedonicus]
MTPRDAAPDRPTPTELAGLLAGGPRVGVSTSATKVEGRAHEGGRTESVWDAFARRPGAVADGSDPERGARHMERYREDVALAVELGVDVLSFSLSWSRIQPEARGGLRREGIAFYDELVDALLAAGIRPRVALHDHDLPVELQDRGGWLHRDTALRFGDLAYLAAETLGDRVPDWVTLRTPALTTMAGHVTGTHAPGSRLGLDALPTVHHQLLAHGRAIEAIRGSSSSARVGIVNAHRVVEAASADDDDRAAALVARALHQDLFADAVLLGRYPDLAGPHAEAFERLGRVDPADLRSIGQPVDHYGVALADPIRVAAVPRLTAGSTAIPFGELPWTDHPASLDGHPVAPDLVPVVLSGLDAAHPEQVDDRDGSRRDPRRAHAISDHLVQALAAVAPGGAAEGVRLEAVVAGSLLDGFEWEAGHEAPRGLVHVDPRTGDRTPRSSYRFLRDTLRERG